MSTLATLGGTVERHYTDQRTDGITTVLVKTSSANYHYRPCVRLTFTDLQPGDVLDITASAQVSTEHGYACMVGGFIKIGESYLAFPVEHPSETAPGWKWNSVRMTTNVLEDVHHLPTRCAATVVVPELIPDGTVYVQMVLYAASTAAASGDTLALDYGEMTVMVHRNGTPLAARLATAEATLTAQAADIAALQAAVAALTPPPDCTPEGA